MGMGHFATGILPLIAATALLVWVSDKQGNPARGVGKFFAWLSIILSLLLLIGQLYTCALMCMKNGCPLKGMGMGGPGMGMMQKMMPGMDMPQNMPPPAPEKKK